MAAEMAAMEGLEVRTVLTTDDVASAPPDRNDERRGVAGSAFVFRLRAPPPPRSAAGEGWELRGCLDAAAGAAAEGAEATKARASRLDERAPGHVDPGAASATLILRALAASL